MDATFQFDTREFDRALVEYAAITGKAWPEICNDKARDLCFRTVQFLPKADAAAIAALVTREWWPKYIAKRLMRQGGVVGMVGKGRKASFVSLRAFQGGGRLAAGHYTRAEARALSARILSSRKRAISFMKSGFAKAGQALPGRGGGARGKSELTMAQGTAIAAQFTRPVAEAIVTYYSNRGGGDVARKEAIAVKGLQRAINFVAADMQAYIARKMDEAGKLKSAA